MKRKKLIYGLLLILLVSACSAPAVPTIDPLSVQNTAAAAAFTLIAETQASLPTFTFISSTVTSTQTPLPTDTLVSSATPDGLATPTVLLLPTKLAAFTPQATTSSDPCNKALLTWQGPSATFTIVNETKPQGSIILLMSVTTDLGECGWLNIYSNSFSGPIGNYSAGAFVDGKKDFKVFGAFRIIEGGWKIIVRNETIVAQGGCYPNC